MQFLNTFFALPKSGLGAVLVEFGSCDESAKLRVVLVNQSRFEIVVVLAKLMELTAVVVAGGGAMSLCCRNRTVDEADEDSDGGVVI